MGTLSQNTCLDHSVANTELWFPSQRLNFLCLQKDERIVSNPASVATRVFQFRLDPEFFANPLDGIIDFAVSIDTKVEDIDLVSCLVHGQQDRVDTVLNVQVRFALLAVAKHRQARRLCFQFLIEIEDMTMSITLPEYGNETENPGLNESQNPRSKPKSNLHMPALKRHRAKSEPETAHFPGWG